MAAAGTAIPNWKQIQGSDLGHLLGDAVDVAAAVGHFGGHNGLDGVAGEHLLSLLNSQSVVLIAVLGQEGCALSGTQSPQLSAGLTRWYLQCSALPTPYPFSLPSSTYGDPLNHRIAWGFTQGLLLHLYTLS